MGPAGISPTTVWEEGGPVAAQPDAPVTVPEKDDGQRLLKPPPARPDRARGAPMSSNMSANMPADVPAEGRADTPADAAFLCLDAPKGMTVPVPSPFDRWMVRVCSAQGQALVPVMGEAWVAHGSSEAVSILALPPGRKPEPASADFDPRYAYRFTRLAGGRLEDERRKQAASLLTAASGDKALPAEEIWRLDAVSNIGKTVYNLFFYLRGGAPIHIIACLDRCGKALFLDVVGGAKARAAVSATPLRR